MTSILIASEEFVRHQMPLGHPECPERADVMAAVAAAWRAAGRDVIAPREATTEELRRVHDVDYVRRIADTAGTAVALDPDTYTSPDSHEVARLAAGAAVNAVERVWQGPVRRALAMVRPPGHHAERARAMGFCLFNNVAVAAAHARALGVPRVAIVDFDVHHGNGTQHMFEDDASVLYVSMHQSPYYPGTGEVLEVGRGAGAGFTANIPMEAGATDEDYQFAFEAIVRPLLRQFAPSLVLVSAGFDAHERDPLAGMRLTTASFGAMMRELRQAADESCEGRLAAVTEGGYDLAAFRESLDVAVAALVDDVTPAPGWSAGGGDARRGRSAVEASRAALAPFWNL
jgi:acetoin utilization deacetylase AcuC-like enzyme